MNYSERDQWERFNKYYREFPSVGLAVDLSRMLFPDDFIPSMEPRMQKAYADMAELEGGAIANPDENRMVGHYWLRNPALAPAAKIRAEIETTLLRIKEFARHIHDGTIQGQRGRFKYCLIIGIGGSALGPQFVADALGNHSQDKLRIRFFDNTDPDGMQRTLSEIRPELGQTLCVVVSKSGGTKETRNGMIEAMAAYKADSLSFHKHAVAITQQGSELDKTAESAIWLERFPMWDWIGGRTSVLSAVGLLPAAIQGIDIESMLKGARDCDTATRARVTLDNPAAMLALGWYYAGNGRGDKSMVVIPYKDRLQLFSKYLQQLLMESIGKELDLMGRTVNQGLTVFGNKGSTDQHSYIQQLRDGINNFFAVFIEVLVDRNSGAVFVEPGITAGDYLHSFLLGTREALFQSSRASMTITIRNVSPYVVGSLIALFERAVGLYASVVGINAYHQPGVEAGKKAAAHMLNVRERIINAMKHSCGKAMSAPEIAAAVCAEEETEIVFKICEHIAANEGCGLERTDGFGPAEARFRMV